MKITALAVVATAFVFGSLGPASALAPKSSVKHKIVATYLDADQPATPLPLGQSKFDAEVVVCPATAASCTLSMSSMTQLCEATGTDLWGIDVFVDNVLVDGGVNLGSESATCTSGYWSGLYKVTPGTHNVHYNISVNDTVTLVRYSIVINVTTP